MAAASRRDQRPGRPAGAAAADDRRAAGPPAPPIRCSSPTTTSPSTPAPSRFRSGRNPGAGKATKAHDDTYVCDLSGRALVVASGEPSGLSLTLPPVLAQLTEARAAATAAGSSNRQAGGRLRPGQLLPQTFKAVHAAGYDWISSRRAPLAATSRLPVLATIRQYGADQVIAFTNEVIALDSCPSRSARIGLFERRQDRRPAARQLPRPCAGRCSACCAPSGSSRTSWSTTPRLRHRHPRRLHRRPGQRRPADRDPAYAQRKRPSRPPVPRSPARRPPSPRCSPTPPSPPRRRTPP